MVRDIPSHDTDLSWLLRGLVEQVPHARGAVLLSADPADQLSAVASGLFSLARSAAVRFGGSNGVGPFLATAARQSAVAVAGTGG